MNIFYIINIIVGIFAYYLGSLLISKEKIIYVIIMLMAIFNFWISKNVNTVSMKETLANSVFSTVQVVLLLLLILKSKKRSDSSF